MKTILGKKIGMTQVFVNDLRIPVTKIMAGPCKVIQIRKMDVDGYWAVQLGFLTKRAKNTSKPLQGHFKKSKKQKHFPRFLKEIRFETEPKNAAGVAFGVGDIVVASDIFKKGDVVSVTGISKGKGFAGVVKRWGFAGGSRTHGQSDRERAPGSIGQGTTPGRVHKGKKMGGRMGTDKTTVTNLHIIDVMDEQNEILVSGPVPGRIGAFLTMTKTAEGSLKDLEKEVATHVIEKEEGGETPAEGDSKPAESPVKEEKQDENE
ncbi:50S ribosomal protein L3 [Candidatus Microgenomates bacterium]|nr:50S ribosomal protein L3 [Candidatus Microgenomates bacterium]